MICRRNVSGDHVGRPCPTCGHTGMAHPHVGNVVPHCLVCEMSDLVMELREIVTGDMVTD